MLLVALPACGQKAQPGPQSVGTITFEVSGGFTGWDRILTVEPDGAVRVTVVRGPSPPPAGTRVDPVTLGRLHTIVGGAEYALLAPTYLPPPGGADLQDYTITAEVGGRTLKTLTRDGASRPAVLVEVMAILSDIMVAAMRGSPAA